MNARPRRPQPRPRQCRGGDCRQVDLLIEYNADAEANSEVARRLAAAAIPALALVDPLPGAPLYGPDNRAASRIAGARSVMRARDLAGREGARGADR